MFIVKNYWSGLSTINTGPSLETPLISCCCPKSCRSWGYGFTKPPLHTLQHVIDGVGELLALNLGLGGSWIGQPAHSPAPLQPVVSCSALQGAVGAALPHPRKTPILKDLERSSFNTPPSPLSSSSYFFTVILESPDMTQRPYLRIHEIGVYIKKEKS